MIKSAVHGISDHSPLVVSLEVRQPSTSSRAWKLNALWLNLIPSQAQVATRIASFWHIHAGHPDVGVV